MHLMNENAIALAVLRLIETEKFVRIIAKKNHSQRLRIPKYLILEPY